MAIEEGRVVAPRVQPPDWPALPVLNEPKWSCPLLLATIGVIIGTAVPVGYNVAVIYSSAGHIMKSLNESQTTIHGDDHMLDTVESKRLFSGVTACFFTGGCLGSIAGFWCRDRYSSKILLTIFIATAPQLYICGNLEVFQLHLASRFAAGIASGLSTTIVPMYLSEIAPKEFYGTLATMIVMGVSGGIVIAQTMTLPEFLGAETTWGPAFSVYVFANIVGLLLLPFSPESPDYLYVIAGRRDEARNDMLNQRMILRIYRKYLQFIRLLFAVLRRLRGNDIDRINRELDALQKQAVRRAKLHSFWSMLMDPKLLVPILHVVIFYSLQFVLWGINAVVFYSSDLMFKQVFEDAVKFREETWHNVLFQFGLNVFVVLIVQVYVHRSNRRSLYFIYISCTFFAMTLIEPFVFNWTHRDAMGHRLSSAVPFFIIINALPMLMSSIAYCMRCEIAPPSLVPITTLFFLFCIGLSFVSMHSFVGSDGLWLWTIYFFSYLTVYYTFVFLRQHRYLHKKKKRSSNIPNEQSATSISKFISIKFDRRWISYKLRVDN